MQVFLNICGTTAVTSVTKKHTVGQLRTQLNVHPLMRLCTKHRILCDRHTLEHYGVEDNDTIYGHMISKGGLPIVETGVLPAIFGTFTAYAAQHLSFLGTSLAKDTVEKAKGWFERIKEFLDRHRKFIQFMLNFFKFLPIMTLVLMVIAFLARPTEFMLLIFGLLSATLIYIIYSTLNLPPFIYIIFALWFFVVDIIPLIIYCMIFGAIFILIFVICLILTAVNTVTGGALKSIVLCQNSPGSWYKTPTSQYSNKWERGIFCSRPCYGRYKPDVTGTSCVRLPKGIPPYCPQAEIMRIYSSKKADRNHIFNDFKESTNFKYKSQKPEERENMLKQHYMKKFEFFDTCRKQMNEYDPIALNICASADSLEATRHLDKNQVKKLKQVCAQAYCNGGRNYPFCSKISGFRDDDENEIIRKTVRVVVIILIFCIVFLILIQYLYQSNGPSQQE